MYLELLKNLLVTTAVLVIHQTVQLVELCPADNCLTGGFFFAPERQMVNSHALLGHVFDNFTVTDPIECFRKCRCDCRCISFNYLTNMIEKNCELNEENRHTNSSALKPVQGSQYYDLVVNYDIKVRNIHNFDQHVLQLKICLEFVITTQELLCEIFFSLSLDIIVIRYF